VSTPSRFSGRWPSEMTAPSCSSSSTVGRALDVAAGDRQPALQRDPRDRGHADAADADEVDPAEVLGRRQRVEPLVVEPVDVAQHVAHSSAPRPPDLARRPQSSAGPNARPAAPSVADDARARRPPPRTPSPPEPRRRPAARTPRRPCPSRQSLPVGEQRQQVLRQPRRGELLVVHQQPAARAHHRLRVEPLLAVADRQRHVHRGQSDGGELGAGHHAARQSTASAAAYARSIRSRYGTAHVAAPGTGNSARPHASCRGRVACRICTPAAEKASAAPSMASFSRRAPCEPPNTSSVAGPAPGQQPEELQRLGAPGGRSRGDHPAQRHAEVASAAEPAVRRAGGDPVRHPRPDAVGQAGAHVRLVHDDRHAAAARGEVGGQRDVAAEADDDVRRDLVEHLDRPAHRPGEPGGHGEHVHRGLARQRHGRDQLERVAAGRDELGVQAPWWCRGR
jgi:hypothetical protein